MWFLMMIARMLPSATSTIMLYGGLARRARGGQAVLAPTSIFAGAYLAVWGGFSALAALAQWLLVRSGAVSEVTLAFGNQRVCGALLIASGLYQATPLKRACLQNWAVGWRRSRRGRHAHWPPYGCRRNVARLSGRRRKPEQWGFERSSTSLLRSARIQKVLSI